MPGTWGAFFSGKEPLAHRCGDTVPSRFASANRAAASKQACFSRRWRRSACFPTPRKKSTRAFRFALDPNDTKGRDRSPSPLASPPRGWPGARRHGRLIRPEALLPAALVEIPRNRLSGVEPTRGFDSRHPLDEDHDLSSAFIRAPLYSAPRRARSFSSRRRSASTMPRVLRISSPGYAGTPPDTSSSGRQRYAGTGRGPWQWCGQRRCRRPSTWR